MYTDIGLYLEFATALKFTLNLFYCLNIKKFLFGF